MIYDIGDLVYTWARFTSRALTTAEERTWREDRTLPEGVGVDPETLKGNVEKPDGTVEEVSVSQVEEKAGVYRAEVEAAQAGSYTVAIDGTGGNQASGEHTYQVRVRGVER